MPIQAVQHVRRMRGGAQSHLMRCADGHHYVVKFANNPQHPRVLVNDWLGTRLAEMIELPVPVPAIVDVHPWLVEHTPDLRVELGGQRTMFTAGLSFGSRYVVSPLEGQVHDYLPEGMLGRVRNVCSFAGILALDKWTCNADGRQVAFWRRPCERKFTASFIDQGYFFNAGEWSFPDAPLRGVLRAQRRVCRCHRVGQLRAVVEQDRKLSGEFAVATHRTDSSGVVRFRQRRIGATPNPIAGAPLSGARVYSVFQKFVSEPLPELARGVFGGRCERTLLRRRTLGRLRVPDGTAGKSNSQLPQPVWAGVRVGDYSLKWISAAKCAQQHS